jgi:dynactin-5
MSSETVVGEADDADDDYIKTTTHNYVSRKAVVDGAKRVEIKGRSILHKGVRVRGDLQIVKIGRYCEIGSSTTLEPPLYPYQKTKRVPLIIGSHTHIGKDCDIKGAAIGSSK